MFAALRWVASTHCQWCQGDLAPKHHCLGVATTGQGNIGQGDRPISGGDLARHCKLQKGDLELLNPVARLHTNGRFTLFSTNNRLQPIRHIVILHWVILASLKNILIF